jgi:hypothetical protein
LTSCPPKLATVAVSKTIAVANAVAVVGSIAIIRAVAVQEAVSIVHAVAITVAIAVGQSRTVGCSWGTTNTIVDAGTGAAESWADTGASNGYSMAAAVASRETAAWGVAVAYKTSVGKTGKRSSDREKSREGLNCDETKNELHIDEMKND